MLVRWLYFVLLCCLFPAISKAEESPISFSSHVGYSHMAVIEDVSFFTAPDTTMSFQDSIYVLSSEGLIECYSASHITALLPYHDGILVVLERKSLMESVLNTPARTIQFMYIHGKAEECYLELQLPEHADFWNARYRNNQLYVQYMENQPYGNRQSHILIYNSEGQQICHYSNTGALYDTCFIVSRGEKNLNIYDIETGCVYETDLPQYISTQLVSCNGFLYYTNREGLHRYSYHTHIDEIVFDAEGIGASTNFIVYRNVVYIMDVPDTCVTVLNLDTMGTTTIEIPVYPQYAAISNNVLFLFDRDQSGGIAAIDLDTLKKQVWQFNQAFPLTENVISD